MNSERLAKLTNSGGNRGKAIYNDGMEGSSERDRGKGSGSGRRWGGVERPIRGRNEAMEGCAGK